MNHTVPRSYSNIAQNEASLSHPVYFQNKNAHSPLRNEAWKISGIFDFKPRRAEYIRMKFAVHRADNKIFCITWSTPDLHVKRSHKIVNRIIRRRSTSKL